MIDVIGADSEFGEQSRTALKRCADEGVLVTNPVVLAEVSAYLDAIEELDEAMPTILFRRDSIPMDASFLAGQAFRKYKLRGGKRQRMLAGFLIGAHAAVAGFVLLSRDIGYSRYFDLDVLDPSSA